MVRLLRREPVQTGMVRPFWVVVGFSRPANRLLAFWVMLVSVRRPGFGVFPPETPSRSFAANGVLGEPVTRLFARVAAADTPSAGGTQRAIRQAGHFRTASARVGRLWGVCPGGEIHQLRRFLGFDTECKKLTPTGGGIIMRALEPKVVNVVWTAVEALIPSREDNHPLRCHNPHWSCPGTLRDLGWLWSPFVVYG